MYKIKSVNAPKGIDDVTIGVSVGSSSFEGEKLDAIVEWCTRRFKRMRILIGDHAQIMRLRIDNNLDEGKAILEASKIGDEWIDSNATKIYAGFPEACLVRWRDCKTHPLFTTYYDAFERAANAQINLQDAMRQDMSAFCARNANRTLNEILPLSRKYLIEKMVVHSIIAGQWGGVRIYPAKNMKCLDLVARGYVHDVPDLMSQEKYCEIMIKRRKAVTKLAS